MRFRKETQAKGEQSKRDLVANFERRKGGVVEDIVAAIVTVRL